MKIEYESYSPSREGKLLIESANEIIEEYLADGYDLTLRQLFYQFVARDLFENSQQNYNRLGNIVSRARKAGLIDWDAIVDRTRNVEKFPSFDSPKEVLEIAADTYRVDPWQNQMDYIEVWFEKDALEGVFRRVHEKWRVNYLSCRGYCSDSELHTAARRLLAARAQVKEVGGQVRILYFGDHDPSGLHMPEDIKNRLKLFGLNEGKYFAFEKLALDIKQVQKYKPPPNFAKSDDPRFKNYLDQYGSKSWELDALDPKVLVQLASTAIKSRLNPNRWNDSLDREKEERFKLKKLIPAYDDMIIKPEEDWRA